jgi:hypothetical protein
MNFASFLFHKLANQFWERIIRASVPFLVGFEQSPKKPDPVGDHLMFKFPVMLVKNSPNNFETDTTQGTKE